MANVGRLLEPGDDGIPDGWIPCVGQDELIEGIETFMSRVNDDAQSHECFQKIRDDARNRVVLSRLDP